MNFIRTAGGLHLFLNGKTVTLASSDPIYPKVVQAISAKASETEVQAILNEEKLRLEAATRITEDITLKNETLYFRDEAIVGTLGIRMLQCLREGFDLTPWSKFLGNLALNPSNRVATRLYDFLEVGKNAITPAGNFLAFKAVRPDWFDIHSASFDNSVGNIVSMPRNKVNDDDEYTCSHGLHVCSFDYLPHFSHANGHVVICEVNPADVVSIPKDYNDTKMRVCKYQVVAEYPGYYTGKGNILANTSVRGDADEPFVLELQDEPDGDWTEVASYAKLSEGALSLEDAFNSNPEAFSARLTNRVTESVIDSKTNPDYVSDDEGSEDWPDERQSFSIVGVSAQGTAERLEVDRVFTTLSEALDPALQYVGDYACVQILDPQGLVALTVS